MEATKDSSPWNDDDDDLTREHVDGQHALAAAHPNSLCGLRYPVLVQEGHNNSIEKIRNCGRTNL